MLQVCRITCCGRVNFEQHCVSRRHLRKAARTEQKAADRSVGPAFEPGRCSDTGQVAVGELQALCRSYCKQARLFSTTTDWRLSKGLCAALLICRDPHAE